MEERDRQSTVTIQGTSKILQQATQSILEVTQGEEVKVLVVE